MAEASMNASNDIDCRCCAQQPLSGKRKNCAEVIDGTGVRHRVLPGGSLCAKIERLRLDAGVLQRGWYGMRVVADGATDSSDRRNPVRLRHLR